MGTAENCNTDCSTTTCINTFQRILMAHDTCEESQLPTDLETGLHSFEDACENHVCNANSPPSPPSSSSSKLFSWKLTSVLPGRLSFSCFDEKVREYINSYPTLCMGQILGALLQSGLNNVCERQYMKIKINKLNLFYKEFHTYVITKSFYKQFHTYVCIMFVYLSHPL